MYLGSSRLAPPTSSDLREPQDPAGWAAHMICRNQKAQEKNEPKYHWKVRVVKEEADLNFPVSGLMNSITSRDLVSVVL